jgi:hypothetical protein
MVIWMKTTLRRYLPRVVLSVVFLLILGTLLTMSFKSPEGSEETLMTNLAVHFPNYSTSSSWVTSYHFNYTPSFLEEAYTMPVWHHPPLDTILLIPIVHISTNLYFLRLVSILLFIGALILVTLAVRKETKRYLFVSYL